MKIKQIKILISFLMILCISILSNNNFVIAANIINATNNLQSNGMLNYSSPYRQSVFHPIAGQDNFGNLNNKYPIMQVSVSNNDFTKKNLIALTFDSAYINDYTYTLLDILDVYNAKCTFFMTSKWAKDNPEHVREILRRGHEIGNHSNTHPRFNEISKEKMIKEVTACHDTIKAIAGVDTCLFRFPYGSYNREAIDTVVNLGYYPIQWTFDSFDWKNESKEILINRFNSSSDIKEGSIILCHNGAAHTTEALPYVMELLKLKGLNCVKVSDLIYHHNFIISNGTQISE